MTEILKDKSVDNQKAAYELFSKKICFGSVVHCCYYACFQLMKYRIFTRLDKSEIDFYNDLHSLNRIGKHKSEHKYCIEIIYNTLRQNDLQVANNFNNFVTALKTYREQADYKCIKIIDEHCKKALKLTEKLFNILNYKY